MKNKKKILIIIAATLFTLLFILPAIAFSIVNWGILPHKKLTPIVVREVNKYIKGEFVCEKIELTFFNTYPHLGLRLTNGEIISHALADSTMVEEITQSPVDSLFHFNQITLTIRPMDYLSEGKITIRDVLIENPHFHGYLDREGNANWDIYISEKEIKDSKDTTALPPIDLQKLRIQDGHFIYNDRQADMYAEIDGFFLELTGSLIQGGNTLAIETGSSSILFESPDYTLNNKLALLFKSTIELTDNFKTVTLQDAEMMLNNLPFTADGSLTYIDETKTIGMNLEAGLKASDLNDLLQFIPESYLKNKKDIKATGSIRLDANIVGELGDSIMPTINAYCLLENGSYFMKGVEQGIDSLEVEMNIHMNGPEPHLSYVTLDKMHLTGMNTSFQMHGQVKDILQSPAIDATVKGRVDLTRMAKDFFDPDTFLLQGFLNADIEASFKLNDLMDGRYNNISALGKLNIDSLKAFSVPFETDIYISGAHFSVDSSKVTSSYIAGEDLLNGVLTVDSMHVKYKEDINTLLSGMEITAKTSPVIDTTAVMSVTSHIRIEQLRTRMPDSVWVVAKKTYLRGGIKPSSSNKQIPQIGASITVDSLRYFDIPSRMGISMAGSTFNVEALPYRDAIRQRFQAMQSDSTRRRPERNMANRGERSRTNPRQAQTDSLSSSGQLLRNWEVRGSVSFNQMRLFSRMFPLPMRMEKSKVKFDTNTIQFTDAMFHAGKSNFKLTGQVNSLRRAMLRGGKLQGKFSVSSDYIDCNELVQAASLGMLYAEQQEENTIQDEKLVVMDENVLQDSITVVTSDTTEVLFIVPSFLDMSLNMNAKKLDYKDLQMEDVTGEIVLRNQSINLKKLDMQSNMGKGNFSMYYTAKNHQNASVGFDMDMQGILVDKLIDLYPAIDTLLPMLRSFEGVVDCQMAVTCDVDSTTSVILPSLNAGCYVKGKDMVLLDGETFTEISKTLMFKNKKKNAIDNISVDFTIKDNKIDVYPFLVEIDRYRVAVGGTHNLDMTFDYHVSVLKSPVPFKLGIDVTGNLDNFKYKIVKCRYKDIFQPAKQKELDPTPSNLRAQIREYIRQQIIENAPELAANIPPSRNSETVPQNEEQETQQESL